MNVIRRFVSVLALCFSACLGYAECKSQTDFGGWLNCKIEERKAAKTGDVAAAAGKVALKTNAGNGTKQEEAPSAASQTTSLVDQSSASDLFNLALHLAKLNTGDINNDTNSVTVTTSAYALYAAANFHDPLDPAYYASHTAWRRLYLTLGRDAPDSTANHTGQDPHKTQTGTIAGFKYLIVNDRDITAKANEKTFASVTKALAAATADRDGIQFELNQRIPEITTTRFSSLTNAEEQLANSIIDARITSSTELDKATQDAVDKIKRNRQWSVAYTAEIRGAQGFNEHKATILLDWGLRSRLNLTANLGLDSQDGKHFSRDMNGGTAAMEFQYRITEDMKQPQPFLLSFAGNGSWLTNTKPVYKAQVKLTFPLGQKTGVSMPLSVTYASRPDLIQESHVEGRFGFTFDAQKLAGALMGSK